MAYNSDKKSTELDALTSLADDDVVIVGDADDSGRAKKITAGNLADDLFADTTATDTAGIVNNNGTVVADETVGGTGQSSYTKGDILVATGASTLTKLPIGSDNNVLIADSGESSGIKWGAAPVDTQTFTSSGTWTKPANANIVVIEAWGAGGSGAYTINNSTAQGGAGGAYIKTVLPASSLGATETVTVGTGGSSQTSGGANGTAGGDTTFGTTTTFLTASGGGAGTIGGGLPAGGIGSETLDNPSKEDGGDGSDAITAAGSTNWAGAGGGGIDGTTPNPKTNGGTSTFGGDGGDAQVPSTPGEAGTAPGGGGAGSDGAASGAGGDGKVIVYTW